MTPDQLTNKGDDLQDLRDARDLARYRFLRLNWDAWTGICWRGTPEEIAHKLDVAIDAHMFGFENHSPAPMNEQKHNPAGDAK